MAVGLGVSSTIGTGGTGAGGGASRGIVGRGDTRRSISIGSNSIGGAVGAILEGTIGFDLLGTVISKLFSPFSILLLISSNSTSGYPLSFLVGSLFGVPCAPILAIRI
jgi:hypothetical protein